VESRFESLLPLFQERMATGGDFLAQAEPFYADAITHHLDDLIPKGLAKEQAKAMLEILAKDFKELLAKDGANWDAPSLEALIRGKLAERSQAPAIGATQEQLDEAARWSNKTVFTLLRVAATGRKEAPPLFDTLAQIGFMKVIERMGLAMMKLK
jgi:glutamyl/glutaminyl-tRNA synthetase